MILRSKFNIKLLCLLLFLIGLSCSEAPFEPEPVVNTGYNVYFQTQTQYHTESLRWYTYNPETDKLDSLILPISPAWGVVISPSGDRLYMDEYYGYDMLVIDLENREQIYEFADARIMSLSPDGKLLAVAHEGFELINTDDMTTVYHSDVLPLSNATFSWDGNYLLGGVGREYGWVSVDDPETVVEEEVNIGLGLYLPGDRVLDSPLSNHLYFNGYRNFIIAWDRDADSAVFVDTAFVSSGYYSLHISNNGKYVAYAEILHSNTKRYTVLNIYDTELHQIVHSVATNNYHENGDTTFVDLDEIVITPDSKWLVGISHQSRGYFFVYNLEELKVERYVALGGEHGPINLVCQTGE